MENLTIKETEMTPAVNLNCKSGMMQFYGNSYPEDAGSFYIPIMNWLDNYVESPAAKSILDIDLGYLNSFSSKYIMHIMEDFQKIYVTSGEVSVVWYYEMDDDDMKEVGEMYQDIFEFPIELIEKE